MNKILLFLLATLGIFGGLLVGGYAAYGLPGALGAFVLFCVGVKLLIGHVKRKFLGLGKALFDAKSRVLRDAEVTVHGVQTAPKVELDVEVELEDEDDPAQPSPETKFFFLDVTIVPKESEGDTPFQCWDSTELELVSFDAPVRTMDDEALDSDESESCRVHHVEYLEAPDGAEAEDAGKALGGQKLRLHVEVPKHLTRLKFQYYFESFGDVRVP